MAAFTQEAENYIRMELLLTGVSPRGVRILFDREFAPICLQATIRKEFIKLNDLKTKRILNQKHWDILHPMSGSTDPKTFDVTLMITLIRNLTTLSHPSCGFDRLPSSRETTPCADLARIKHYRNYIAHLDDNKVDNPTFNTAWDDISDALWRLGGPAMLQECQELKTKPLDLSNQEIMLDIKHSNDEIQHLKELVESLKRSYDDLQCGYKDTTEDLIKIKTSHEDTVPWNIRGQIQSTQERWKKTDEKFVETRASAHVLKCIKTKSCVTVTGNSGVGKTATVRHVALLMAGEGYDILPVTDPSDINKFYNPNKKTLYVFDDLCGKYTLNQNSFDKLSEQLPFIDPLLEHIKIIMSCRLQVYKDKQFEVVELFKSCECNLLSKQLCLLETEKVSIAKMYLKTNASKIKQYSDKFDFFPLLCHLYNENPTLDVVDFFQNPFLVYESELDKLKIGAYTKFCSLALCVTCNNMLKEEWLTEEVDTSIDIVIQNICEVCKLNRGTSKLLLRDELDSLLHTFLKKENNVYSKLHDKVFDFLSYYFGEKMIKYLIKNATCSFIKERFLFEKQVDSDQYITIVPERHQEMYLKRMIDDWTQGEVVSVFCNINMNVLNFRQMFLSYINKLDISYQRQLAHTVNSKYKDNVLIQCCFIGDIDFIQWCLRHNVDVNQQRYDGCTPLLAASQKGHINIVNILLSNKADINTCCNNGESSLYVASHKGHVEIVNLLLTNKADINKCSNNGASPLFVACLNGHIEIVKLLLSNKADINKFSNNGASPLFVACHNGHIEIVKLLLSNKADINKCNNNEVSSLYVASHLGHKEIVKLLLTNKADINKCSYVGVSPLYVECAQGHIEIVNVFLSNKADINKCSNIGVSPLSMACQIGHTEIVKLLLTNKADINKCSNDGVSPLYVISHQGHIEIVKLLLTNKADINKCSSVGVSPLYRACQQGHIEIVIILLSNKADINKCSNIGASPLFIACENGHIEIVKLLLTTKADINKCSNIEASPLSIACQNGHIETVKLLLTTKADINKCDNHEVSPLYAASHQGHVEIVKLLLSNKAVYYYYRH